MTAKYLWEIGSLMISIMGVLHLVGTLFTAGMHPTNQNLIKDMQTAPLNLTNKLTLWKSWIGFNATHSSGVIFLGVINFYLAWKYFTMLQQDWMFSIITLIVLSFYVWVARTYWFKDVFILLSIALLIFSTAEILMFI